MELLVGVIDAELRERTSRVVRLVRQRAWTAREGDGWPCKPTEGGGEPWKGREIACLLKGVGAKVFKSEEVQESNSRGRGDDTLGVIAIRWSDAAIDLMRRPMGKKT